MQRIGLSLGGVLVAAGAWLALSAPAFAQMSRLPAPSFGAAPSSGFARAAPAPSTPSVARYVVESQSFTLDTSGPVPLLRYSNSVEVFALKPQPAPRGDTLFVNDAGDTVLRATRYGGLIAFSPNKPQGAAAALSGPASPLGLPEFRSVTQVLQFMGQSSRAISRMVGRPVDINAPDIGPTGLSLVADAMNVTVEAFSKVTAPKFAGRQKSKAAGLAEVRVVEGEPPRAYVDNDALVVVVTPGKGVAGRPSSLKIVKALSR